MRAYRPIMHAMSARYRSLIRFVPLGQARGVSLRSLWFPARTLLAVLVLLAWTASALAGQAGNVSRVQGEAQALRFGLPVQLALGAPVMSGDLLMTGPGARLEVDFLDGTRLTLGENTHLDIDHYAFDPDEAALSLHMTVGVFRVVSGAIAEINPDKFAVSTPLAAIGIRGTDFWGGYLEKDQLSVLLISGSGVTVTSQVGTVLIQNPGQGVTVDPKSRALPLVKAWSDQRQARAFATVSFD